MAGTAVDGDRLVAGTAKSAGVWLAPVGSTLPTTASEALDAAFWTVGYVGDDGVSLGGDSSSEDVFAWQSVAPVKTIITGRQMTVGFTLIETSPETLALYFDTDAPTETGGAFTLDVPSTPGAKEYAVVVDVQDGTTELRFVFPKSALSEAGEITVTKSGVIGYPVTLKALDVSGTLATVLRAGS